MDASQLDPCFTLGMGNSAAEPPVMDDLKGQIAYFDKQSGIAKKRYQSMRVITILLAASIPIVAVFEGSVVIAAVIGALIVVMESLQQLFQYHERWVGFRSAWNTLTREERLYRYGAGPYADTDDREQLLCERFEGIMESENLDWKATAAKAKEQDQA